MNLKQKAVNAGFALVGMASRAGDARVQHNKVQPQDILLLNSAIRLETFVEQGFDIHITRALTPYPHIQTGNFFVTRSPYRWCFFCATWNSKVFIHHAKWDQAAMIYLMDRYPSRRIKVSPNRSSNSLAEVPDAPDPYQKGDFMVHFPGVPNRGVLMAEYAALDHRAATSR